MYSFHYWGPKGDLKKALKAELDYLITENHLRPVEHADYLKYAERAELDTLALPHHVAGVTVSFVGHADEHTASCTYAVQGIHLSSHTHAEKTE